MRSTRSRDFLRGYREKDTRGYVVEAMWKFLLYSELALTALVDATKRPAGLQPDAEEWELNQFLHGAGADLNAEFDVRLERAILRLEETNISGSVEEERASIVEALYRDQLSQLQMLLREALAGRSRITILIDNLDKAWGPELWTSKRWRISCLVCCRQCLGSEDKPAEEPELAVTRYPIHGGSVHQDRHLQPTCQNGARTR